MQKYDFSSAIAFKWQMIKVNQGGMFSQKYKFAATLVTILDYGGFAGKN